jgi:heptaprenyl diphosphate synthase
VNQTLEITREDIRIASFAALAIAIHVLESSFPSPVPGVKPGLANIITLLVLFRYGWKFAAWVSLLRVVAGSLIIGTFMSPTFLLSLSGALASLLAMLMLRPWTGKWVGVVGISVLSSVCHVLAQLLVAWWLFIHHHGLLLLTPLLITAGILFGIFNAIIAASVEKRLSNPA